jgi:hypothetical protein
VLAPEDVILLLLNDFKRSNERADDLWYDLLAVVKVQSTDLDMPFLVQQAAALNVTELLGRAIDDAGPLIPTNEERGCEEGKNGG